MKRYLLAFYLAFSLVLQPAVAVAADTQAGEGTRYFIPSTKPLWRGYFGARHTFEGGFTTDLSDLQLRVARLAGLKPVPVKSFTILPNEAASGSAPLAPTGRKPTAPRQTPSAQVPWGIALVRGSSETPTGGAGVTVAILDTGVTKDHPDLQRRIAACKDFTQAKTPIVDGKCDDTNGHGTHVAGIIAADGGTDGAGIFGVAPEATVLAFKVCGRSGSCWSDDIAAAIRLAADAGANIVNLSLGSDTTSSLISEAVAYATDLGVLIVAAAGNDGPYDGSIDYPGAQPEVAAVGAIDSELGIAEWSSRGINAQTQSAVVEEGDIEFAAPGVNVESAYRGGGYAILSGTSMASPHVAGLAALLWDTDGSTTRDILHLAADDLLPVGDDGASGFGLPTL